MKHDAVFILLLRLFEATSLGASLAWIVDYTRQRGWHNIVGRNLLTKTVIITLLLLIGFLTSLFRFSPGVEEFLSWAYLVLLAAIGPVMVWRMAVLRRVGTAVVTCPAGHTVTAAARYCPECGILLPPSPPGKAVAD